MKKIFWTLAIFILIVSAFEIWWFSQHIFTGGIEELKPLPDDYVMRVIDGDTIELVSREVVRLLCIDTPEEGEEGYEEAKDYLESLILGKEVILEADVQDKDVYGRSLRYIYLNDSDETIFINKELYQKGYAEMMIIPPSTTRCDEVASSET